jgi:starch phosphorylase
MPTFATTPPIPTSSAKSPKKDSSQPAQPADPAADAFGKVILHHLTSTMARHPGAATPRDWWIATALATRDRIHERMIETQAIHNEENVRRIYYFSMEYLMGRLFESNLLATGLTEQARTALTGLGVDFDAVREAEVDMGLSGPRLRDLLRVRTLQAGVCARASSGTSGPLEHVQRPVGSGAG